VDGAFVDTDNGDLPALHTPSAELWRWANKHKCKVLTFDCKYASLSIEDSHYFGGQRRRYHYTPPGRSHDGNCAEIFLVRFEALLDHIIILPRRLWQASITKRSVQGEGVSPLISGMPPCFHPMVVHNDDLLEARDRLLTAARSGTCYVNPTTGVEMKGWDLKLTDQPAITPIAMKHDSSFNCIAVLWDRIESQKPTTGVEFCFNPIAPLIADFLLRVPGISTELRIEHKLGKVISASRTWRRFTFLSGARNPFASTRQWHYLIWQTSVDDLTWYCFARHDIPETWLQNTTLNLDERTGRQFLYEGEEGFLRMLTFIQSSAPQAIHTVNEILQRLKPGELELDSLVTSNIVSNKARMRAITAAFDSTILTNTKDDEGPGHNWNSGLDWLCDPFNMQCRREGFGALLPLDPGHPFGSHMVVDHKWSDEQKKAFNKDRTLPITAYSRHLDWRSCMILQLWDLSHYNVSERRYPLWMRRGYWRRPATDQPYFIIGATADPDVLRSVRRPPPYLLFPSQFTSHLNQENVMNYKIDNGHDGSKYFRSESVEETHINKPSRFSSTIGAMPFEAGSDFMADKNINPLRYLVNFHDGSIYRHIRELLTGEGTMRIENPQSTIPNDEFDKASYRTTVGKVHQAAWDYGGNTSSLF
jgi:hypothetical protein